MEDIHSIVVSQNSKKVTIKKNPNNYEVLGRGQQGAVLKLSPERCVKLYTNSTYAAREEEVLRATEKSRFFPKVYETGENYIIMEFLDGPDLHDYIKKNGMTEQIARELVLMLREMEKLGFARIDCMLRHVFVVDQEKLKVIDHVNAYRKSRPFPKKLFKGLSDLGVLKQFLTSVKTLDEDRYEEWKRSKSYSKYF